MKHLLSAALILLSVSTAWGQALVQVKTAEEIGTIGPMNGVGGGISSNGMTKDLYKGAGIPFARLHDVGNTMKHCVEIMNIFPNFEADENKPESYDFIITDQYIKNIVDCGTEIIYRLKNTGHEPGTPKKYGAWPPKDFKKWARICEHVVRHYNDGWADGFHYNIKYWEIWNEPDMDQKKMPDGRWRYQVSPHSWGGTMEQYYDLFEITFKHLKKTHPDLLVGGPANADFESNEPFLKEMKKRGVDVDFFSWHRYSRVPERLSEEGHKVRALLDSYGYDKVPTILDEWNYNYDWTPEGQKYSREVRQSIKGSAYTAACICHMQNEGCTDILTYYDFRNNTSYNGAWDRQQWAETATYYVFWAWNRLKEYGTQVATEYHQKDIYAVAAKNQEGKIRLLVVRYNDNNNVYKDKIMYVPLPEGASSPLCMLSDSNHMNTAYPFPITDIGIKLTLQPNSFVYIEL